VGRRRGERGTLEEFTQPDPEIGAEGSHILSHGAVNLGRTQIKFRARETSQNGRSVWSACDFTNGDATNGLETSNHRFD